MALKAIVGEKVAMSQVWVNDKVVPVTVLRVEPARIVQVKTTERDGYTAIPMAIEALRLYLRARSGARNVADASAFIRQAAAKGAQYIQTPEITTLMETERARFLRAPLVVAVVSRIAAPFFIGRIVCTLAVMFAICCSWFGFLTEPASIR